MPILNYTTQIDSYKTITEIQQILAKHGATKIVMDNNEEGLPVALTFCIVFKDNLQAFKLPCNIEGVRKALQKNKKIPRAQCTEAQALRVGWRILKDWVAAQMAIVEAELATTTEVFLPYMVLKSGDTLYGSIQSGNVKGLLN